jgi:hypothetical protein
MRNFFNDLGLNKGREKTGHSSLPMQETKQISYVAMPNQFVISSGRSLSPRAK